MRATARLATCLPDLSMSHATMSHHGCGREGSKDIVKGAGSCRQLQQRLTREIQQQYHSMPHASRRVLRALSMTAACSPCTLTHTR